MEDSKTKMQEELNSIPLVDDDPQRELILLYFIIWPIHFPLISILI